MLDKGQIGGWDGEPEDAPDAKKPAAQPAKVEAPVVSAMAAPEPANDAVRLTPQQADARKRRGQWLALGLFAFVILLFVLTMTKIGGSIVHWGAAFE